MKARMLFVSPELPWPPVSGGCLRTLSLLKCLAVCFRIHLVTFAEEQPDESHLSPLRAYAERVTVVPLLRHRRDPWRRYARNLGRALRFVHPLVDRYSEPQARAALRTLLEGDEEWIWLEHLWVAPYVAGVQRRAKTILDLHNVESDYYRQLRKASQVTAEKLGYYVFEQAARRLERRYLGVFDCVVSVSEEDRRLLAHDCPDEKIFVLPNAVSTHLSPGAEGQGAKMLLFAGRLDYPPNALAVQWFHGQVWPLIREQEPSARWTIVGSSPELLDPAVQQDRSVILTGQVEHVEPHLRSSSVVLVPITAGGGTRFKILEAWAAGKAVVSTSAGAQGLAARHGVNIWVADTPQDFSAGVLGLLSDPALRGQLGARGRETVEEYYSLERLQEKLKAALQAAHGAPLCA